MDFLARTGVRRFLYWLARKKRIEAGIVLLKYVDSRREALFWKARAAAAVDERNHYIRLFNRLENAVRRHIERVGFISEHDEELEAAHRAVMKDAIQQEEARGPQAT